MKINISDIVKLVDKYHFFIYNKVTKKITTIDKNDIKQKMNKNTILIKIEFKAITKLQLANEKKSPLKTIGGPVYGLVSTYIMENKKLIKQPKKIKNKVYFPSRYLKDITEKKLLKDFYKIAKKYIGDKLDNHLLAINKINKL